jgi:hypothetical protein
VVLDGYASACITAGLESGQDGLARRDRGTDSPAGAAGLPAGAGEDARHEAGWPEGERLEVQTEARLRDIEKRVSDLRASLE